MTGLPHDPENELLGPVPSQLSGELVDTPDGQRYALTLRTPCTTLTVFLTRTEALAWGNGIVGLARTMNGLVVPRGLGGKRGHG